jgi:HEPN domain-containing protein
MAQRDKIARKFERAAIQRLGAADLLLEHGFTLDAVYLAGYGVECALKAQILRHSPEREFAEVMAKLTEAGAKGHDFEYLKNLFKERRHGRHKTDVEVLGVLSANLKVVSSWSTDLRYEPGSIRMEAAERFCRAAREIRDICARS